VTEATDLLKDSRAVAQTNQGGVIRASTGEASEEVSSATAPFSDEAQQQLQCDYQACARAYRSFRASDCTYQPYSGPRALCEKGAGAFAPRKEASRSSTEARAQARCNVDVCARFYRSFNPSDCTYQPYDGGRRRVCDR
jgi:hypothetical protein